MAPVFEYGSDRREYAFQDALNFVNGEGNKESKANQLYALNTAIEEYRDLLHLIFHESIARQ